ncbi:hypothetical protein HD806DRAFT_316003 [Xylariaceae sp. AK1471]|nr:hypothetical protein HD806DRAFT_316003 [Xylariaceae sp. AK1471]
MGLLYTRHNEDENHLPIRSNSPINQSVGENTGRAITDPWLVVVIIIGILIIATLAIFMLAHYLKSRRERTKSMRLSEQMSSLYPRKRKLSSADQHRIEEQERDMMIRKSLASRTSIIASSPVSQVSSMSDDHLDEPSEEPGETASLREDWKAWEARIQSERKISSPAGAVGLDQHPAFASHLSIPQPTRMPSPIRGIIPSRVDQPLPRIVVT